MKILKVKVQAYITKIATGEIRLDEDKIKEEYRDSQRFLWTEGNYGCDCNRSLFWGRAGGREMDPMDDSDPCGEELYLVRLVVDGEEYLNEPLHGRDE